MTTVDEPVAHAGDVVAVHPMFGRCAARAAVVSRPELWERLQGSARVTVVSAPAGSGKTVLLRSWIDAAGLAERAAWVPVGRNERDPHRFWLAVLGELGSDLQRQLELLVMRAPEQLRFVLATRHDVRLGLHRLRVEGELTEIRSDDLRFSLARRGRCSLRPGWSWPGRRWRCWWTRRRGGRPGCGWRRCA